MDSRLEIRSELERARAGTQALLAPIPDEELVAQISPLQSPLVWDFANNAYFEELWLLRNLHGEPPVAELHDEVYDAFRHKSSERSQLPALRPAAVRAYAADVRERVLDRLEHTDLDVSNPLLRGGFVFGLVVQNELQHQETLLQTVQLRTGVEYAAPEVEAPDRAPAGPPEVHVEGGSFVLGAVDEPWAYDNELIPHEVEVRPFWIDRTPVTNAAFAQFVEDKGYGSKKLWEPEGWAWREQEDAKAPLYW